MAACGGAEERPASTPIVITRADLQPSSDGPPSISARRHVTRVEMMQSTSVPSYDARLISAIHGWAFQPLVLDGKPTAVCSATTFIFEIR